jgi:hypothetical protein
VVTTPVSSLHVTGVDLIRTYFEGSAGMHVTLFGHPSVPVYSHLYTGSLWLDLNGMVALPGVYPGFATRGLPKGATAGFQIATVTGQGVELSNPAIVTVP